MQKNGDFITGFRMNLKKINSFNINFIYGIIIVFHILLLCYIFYSNKPFGGSESYSNIAENWIETGKFSLDGVHDTFYRPPLYPLLLVFAKTINNSGWEVVARMLQSILSIGCSLLVWKIALKISSSTKLALIALCLYLLHFLVQLEHFAQRETVLFELLALCFCYVFISRSSLDWLQVVGLAIISAGLYLTRPTGILFFLAGLGFILWYEGKSYKIKTAFVFVFFFCCFISPWQFYQYKAFSKISFSSSNTAGFNLYKGASPAIQSIYPQIDVDHAEEFIWLELQQNKIDPKDAYLVNSFLMEEAVRFVVDDPLLFGKNMLVKLLVFYSPVVMPLGKGNLEFHDGKILVNNYAISIDFWRLSYFFLCIIIVPLGIVESFRWSPAAEIEVRFKVFSLAIFFLFTCIHVLTFAETRFRLPLDGLLCILTSVFIFRNLDYFKGFKSRKDDLKT